jgi:hypothetical protein
MYTSHIPFQCLSDYCVIRQTCIIRNHVYVGFITIKYLHIPVLYLVYICLITSACPIPCICISYYIGFPGLYQSSVPGCPSHVQLSPAGALHNPNTGLTIALMVQWASQQSNTNSPLLHLVFAKLFPQRNIGWLCLKAGKLLKPGLRDPITCSSNSSPFNTFRIHLGFVSRHPPLN